MNAMPTESFRFCPPERVLLYAWRFSVSPTLWIMVSTSAGMEAVGTPLNAANMTKCSSTVKSGNKISCCGQTPSSLRTAFMSVRIECPMIVASPASGANNPVNIDTTVVCSHHTVSTTAVHIYSECCTYLSRAIVS